MMKRFYSALFKFLNTKLFNRRLTNVPLATILNVLREIVAVYIPLAPVEEMAEFMYKFLKIKCRDIFPHESQASIEGMKIQNWMYKHKMDEFKLIHQLQYFRYLCLAFHVFRNSNPQDFNRTEFGLIKKVNPLIQKKKWLKLFIEISKKNENVWIEMELDKMDQKWKEESINNFS